jgi:hypothetical protein
MPLEYGRPFDPTTGKRQLAPGALPVRLIVVAVISILFGGVSLVAGTTQYPNMADLYRRSIPPAPPVPPPPPPPANVTPYDGDFIRARGLPYGVRDALTKSISQRLKLPPDRSIMLERFLADAGRDAFGDVTPAQAVDPWALITEAGQSSSGFDGKGPFAPHFVVTRFGRLELNNSRVIFTASDPAMSVTLDGTLLTTPDGKARWSARAVKSTLVRLSRRRATHPITAEQAAVLAGHIAEAPANSWPPAS